MCRIAELRCKEVINLKNGERLGTISDVIIDTCCGKIISLVIACGVSLPFLRCDEYIIPWCDIDKIGDDTILVNYNCPSAKKRKHQGWM